MQQTLRLKNPSGEELDVLVRGNEAAHATVVFAHGLGVNKHETTGMYDVVAAVLAPNYRTVQFDFSGFGKSEGRQEDFDYHKHAADLGAILEYVKKTYPGEIYILAHSMGTFVTSLLNPEGIKKAVFSGTPNADTQFIIDRLVKRFTSKPGGKVDLQGISMIPRSTGEIQKFGPQFWKTLRDFRPIEAFTQFSTHTPILIIHPKQDDVVGIEHQEEYDHVPGAIIEWMDGDHSFKKQEDRDAYAKRVLSFFEGSV